MNGTRTTITKRAFASLMMLILGLSAMLIGFASTAGSASAAEGDEECVPSQGSPAVLTEWAPAGTVLTHDSTPPTDPDGSSDESDPANLTKFGAAQESIHVTKDAVPATDGHWDDSSTTVHVWTGGSSASAPPIYAASGAPTIHPSWNATNGEFNGTPHDQPARQPYQTGGGNGGDNASWFLRVGTWVPGTDGTPEVSHTDYTWPKFVRTVRTPATGPVVCEEPTDPSSNPTEGTDPEFCPEGTLNVGKQVPEGEAWNIWCAEVQGTDGTPPGGGDNPGGDNPGGDNPGGDNPGGPEVKGVDGVQPEVLGIEAQAPGAVAPAAAAPTAVDAGLTVGTESGSNATLWVLAGGALVLAGLVLGFGPAPARGKHSL